MTGERAPAVFLDRDGTILHEIDYLADPEQVSLLPGSAEAIRSLNEAGFKVVVATNQSGIARGLLDEQVLDEIHAVMLAELERGGAHIDRIEFCPHHPDHDGVDSPRRKPAPGMLLDAARALDLDLARSWTVGDAERDVAAGLAAGTRGILVETGKGARELERLRSEGRAPEFAVSDLAAAACLILAQGR